MGQSAVDERPHLTSGDLARLLNVDLKTIHNWVNQGHIFGRRTKGRHLRFDRTELVRFMRRFGYPIPAPLGKLVPHVLIHGSDAAAKKLRASLRSVKYESMANFFDVVLELSRGSYEIVVLDVDRTDPGPIKQLMFALRNRADTRGLALVGMSKSDARRRRFVADGGDAAVEPSGGSLAAAIGWLTGSKAVAASDRVVLSAR